MPIVNGVPVPLTFPEALEAIINAAPDSLQFAPGNPPELILANMFAEGRVLVDGDGLGILAALMSPTGALIDMLNPNNPRRAAKATVGYLLLQNDTDSVIPVPASTIFTATTGQQYTIGLATVDVPAHGAAECVVTALETGIGGNIPANRSFSASGLNLTITNPLPWLDGYDRETDALYLQRTIQEKTEYGSQVVSVAAEVELKKYYSAARMYINKSTAGSDYPVPLPGRGYNLVVRTPNGPNASALEIQKIFEILSRRFEFVNSQNVGTSTHPVLGGTVYVSGTPQNYFFTPAQAVEMTLTATILVRFDESTAQSEKISQANDFAAYFIRRVMAFFSGVAGTSTIRFEQDEYEYPTETEIDFAANLGETDPIAPVFGIATVRDLVSDLITKKNTPQLFYDSTPSLELVLDAGVEYETPIVMSLDPYDRQFINFKSDALFSDLTSWFDRYAFIDPAKVFVTVREISG